MELASRIDDYGKPAWIALMVVGFILFWPIGLGLLAYLIWSGRMACAKKGGPGRWHFANEDGRRDRGPRWRGKRWRHGSSGNRAFDEYREDTLRRLEDEQQEFTDFLERLRHARDKAEFDQFMEERARSAKDVDTTDDGDEPEMRPQA